MQGSRRRRTRPSAAPSRGHLTSRDVPRLSASATPLMHGSGWPGTIVDSRNELASRHLSQISPLRRAVQPVCGYGIRDITSCDPEMAGPRAGKGEFGTRSGLVQAGAGSCPGGLRNPFRWGHGWHFPGQERWRRPRASSAGWPEGPVRGAGQQAGAVLRALRNADHSVPVKTRTGSPGRFESRTATRPADRRAISTQLPLGLL